MIHYVKEVSEKTVSSKGIYVLRLNHKQSACEHLSIYAGQILLMNRNDTKGRVLYED